MTAPAACCDACHPCHPHRQMSLVDLPDGGKAWVCHEIERVIFPGRSGERHALRRNTRGGRMLGKVSGTDGGPED
jgi:hypothetical protein